LGSSSKFIVLLGSSLKIIVLLGSSRKKYRTFRYVMASCGAKMGSIFEDIAYAKSDVQFEAALAKSNPKLKAMLAKLEKGEYCNFYCGAALHGRTASQV